MTWSLIRPQSHRKIAWKIGCLSSGSMKAKLMGFTQPGQTGGRIGSGERVFGMYTSGNTARTIVTISSTSWFWGFLGAELIKRYIPLSRTLPFSLPRNLIVHGSCTSAQAPQPSFERHQRCLSDIDAARRLRSCCRFAERLRDREGPFQSRARSRRSLSWAE